MVYKRFDKKTSATCPRSGTLATCIRSETLRSETVTTRNKFTGSRFKNENTSDQ